VAELPTGTVTFLFTDIEGSTRLWQEHPDAMRPALARHDEILRSAIAAHDGHYVKTTGDGAHAVFATASDAIDASVAAQLAIGAEEWPLPAPLRVRMGVHSGPAELRDGDYFGTAVNRAARIMSVAHGGQVVISAATQELARETDIELLDLGEHRLKDLRHAERLFQVVHPGLDAEFSPLRTLDEPAGNLPGQPTSFVGRDTEIAELADLVRARALVTVTGVGGVGKTRLALAVAASVAEDFRHGAWFCELAPVTDPSAVWETLAAMFGLQPTPGRSFDAAVLDYLEPKQVLLVLDNCEHLLSVAAEVVREIGARCREVKVLATSREGLLVAGEQIVGVPSLGVPSPDANPKAMWSAEAVRLFADRARSAKHDFVLTDANVGAVALLCRRLDGIPLAIELAAARSSSLAPDDLAARVDQRFKLLTRGNRAALERHQTLRSTIDWSYDLLTDSERRALQWMSVFMGGADLAALEAVLPGADLDLADVIDIVGQLVDKSLVVADAAAASVRYRMLETIRQYADEHLEASGDAHTARARHASYFATLAEKNRAALRGRDQLVAAQRLAGEVDNFQAAFNYTVESGDVDLAFRLVAALGVRGPSVGYAAMGWAETAIDIPNGDRHALFPEVASWATWSATARADVPLARAYAERMDAAEVGLGIDSAAARREAAVLAFFSGDFEGARVHSDQAIAIARRNGDTYELAMALTLLAAVHDQISDRELALRTGEEAVQASRVAGTSTLAMALFVLAQLLPDDPGRAMEALDEAYAIGVDFGEPIVAASVAGFKAGLALQQGDSALALDLARDAIERATQSGLRMQIGPPLVVATTALANLGRLDQAAILSGVVDGVGRERMAERDLQLMSRAEIVLVERLGQPRVDALRRRGAELSPDELIAVLTEDVEGARTQ
jgi:predicted ATPase/class 3 adenylate cyclase